MNPNPSHNELWRRAATPLVKDSRPTLNSDDWDDAEFDDDGFDEYEDWPVFDEVICVSRSSPDTVRFPTTRRRVDGHSVCDCVAPDKAE